MDAMAGRLLEALEMWEDGVQMMRENLRRISPHATDEEVESALDRWLAGPEGVDSNYVLVEWPRCPQCSTKERPMSVDPTDFQDSNNIEATANDMHNDVEDRLEENQITAEEAEAEHEAIESCVADMNARVPEKDD